MIVHRIAYGTMSALGRRRRLICGRGPTSLMNYKRVLIFPLYSRQSDIDGTNRALAARVACGVVSLPPFNDRIKTDLRWSGDTRSW